MQKIKLLHITSSLKMGGAEAVLCDLISSMDPNTFEHCVIYIHDGMHRECLIKLGVPHYQLQGAISLFDPIFFINLMHLIKKINPDLIHSMLWAGNIARQNGREISWYSGGECLA